LQDYRRLKVSNPIKGIERGDKETAVHEESGGGEEA